MPKTDLLLIVTLVIGIGIGLALGSIREDGVH